MNCPYRKEHEWDDEGLCRYCYAKQPTGEKSGTFLAILSELAMADEARKQQHMQQLRQEVIGAVGGMMMVMEWNHINPEQ